MPKNTDGPDRPGVGSLPSVRMSYEADEEVTSVSQSPLTVQRGQPSAPPRDRNRAMLTIVTGPNVGAIFALDKDELIVGRASDCGVRLDDALVSRHHARIFRKPNGQYAVEDLDSRNGMFVNGQAAKRHDLAEGDRISFGSTLAMRFGMTDELEETLLRRLYESSVLDALTGALNRKHFADRLQGELAYAKRHKVPLAILIFDIDHFKRVNDSHGHLAGDQVLRGLAAVVKRSLRTEDVFARYGGEEFVLIARGTDLDRAMLFGERIRSVVEHAVIPFEGKHLRITVSIGVAALTCCGEDQTAEALLGLADRRLYAAKAAGRNRCVGR